METEETQEELTEFKKQTIKRISEQLVTEIRDHNKVNGDLSIDLCDVINYLKVDYDNPQRIEY